jgi:DNA-binding CsgD family transcriptional regulator
MRRAKNRSKPGGHLSEPASVAGEGLVVLDRSFQPIAFDSGAEALLTGLNGDSATAGAPVALPRELLEALDLRPEREFENMFLRVSVHNHEYTCRTLLVRSHAAAPEEPILALYLKRELSIAEAVKQAGAEYHLTDREQEALIGVTLGLTSKELARRMEISPNTVKAFLRLIMIKMGVTTRAGIVGKLLDQNDRTRSDDRARSEGS